MMDTRAFDLIRYLRASNSFLHLLFLTCKLWLESNSYIGISSSRQHPLSLTRLEHLSFARN